MNTETVNIYLPAVGIISVIFNILLFAKWRLADKKRKEYLDSWGKCSDKLTQSYVDNSKLMSKLSDFQSKRDNHKQE